MTRKFHVHLVSDSTGETIVSVARACLVQFEHCEPTEHVWAMIRTDRQVQKVAAGIEANPGVVLFTMVDEKIRSALIEACSRLGVPCIAVLDPVLEAFGEFLDAKAGHRPGRQHRLDADYFARIAAMDFAMIHDDGQAMDDLGAADVVLVGVSRSSKTPTCIYLANRGIKAANIPIVAGVGLPEELHSVSGPLVVGLIVNPERLLHIRRNRLLSLHETAETDYVDLDAIRAELVIARKLFAEKGWPVIDVTRRSIEETAAAVIALHSRVDQDRP